MSLCVSCSLSWPKGWNCYFNYNRAEKSSRGAGAELNMGSTFTSMKITYTSVYKLKEMKYVTVNTGIEQKR